MQANLEHPHEGSVRVLVCDDEAGLREMLNVLLRRAGYEVTAVTGVRMAVRKIAEEPPYDAVITDLVMPDGSGMEVLDAVGARSAETQVLMITAYATTEEAVEAMRKGAYDYVEKPFKNHTLLATLEKALEKRQIVRENQQLRAQMKAAWRAGDLIGRSMAVEEIRRLVARVASAPASVLITGESGTGKEMVARAIHHQGERAEQPLVVVNCGALPEPLMESELFGHEKGAFTGASHKKEGLFKTAHGGTIFLDEVGELPLSLQVKLLRILQDRKIRPVGAHQEAEVDVRIVAATNRDVEMDVEAGRFRNDLFYRLNVIRIHVPPLRDRPEDIELLAEHFVQKHGAAVGRRLTLAQSALQWLTRQRYPGNVRELENIIERAVTLSFGDQLTRQDLPEGGDDAPPFPGIPLPSDGIDLDRYLSDIEKKLLLRALEQTGGVRTEAAQLLGMTFRSFRYRLAKYQLDEGDGTE